MHEEPYRLTVGLGEQLRRERAERGLEAGVIAR
jgi:hypothetical protein